MTDSIPFFVDRAKGGRASCKGCKSKCESGEIRIAKVVASPYGENQQMKSWHHVDCFMNALLNQRLATKRVDSINDIGNWENMTKDDQELIIKRLNEMEKLYGEKYSGKYTAKVIKNEKAAITPNTIPSSPEKVKEIVTDDNKFSTFCKLCKKIAKVDAYTEKTATVNSFFRKGSNDDSFKGDIALWCKLLLPQVTKRVYNLKSKQLVKLFSRIFNTDHDDMLTHLEQGDVANTIQHFYSKSKSVQPASESTLTIHDIENFLHDLSKLTKEEEQIYHFKKILKRCTLEDLKMIIRLIKGDLRINAGPKHILEGVHPDAYTAFQTSRDLNMVLERVLAKGSGVKHKDASHSSVQAKLELMTPVLPMLAEACKSVEMAMKKCPNGMFSEIKYDGERVQVHKKGKEFKYFSRALKPVMAHKVNHFKDYLPQAFPKGEDLILDAEVLMVDVKTGKPLPFGTLGVHKQSEFKDAEVCLFVFDCLYYNGNVLIDMPIRKRRQILMDTMVEVKNHVVFSEQELIRKPADLANMIAEVLKLGLEGLVLKDLESTYEPGKRHWLKVKKDYLFDGAMADTADLVVLGAWFGTGKKGGMMSVFLMGCLDTRRNKWVTVTKVHTGHDDNTLERLQKELNPLMVKISQQFNSVPMWLDCKKGMVPDYVALDPKKQPVWEITGTELTKATQHTADGISVRFPRVTRIRADKDWQTATNLDELRHLYKTSKEKTDVSLLTKLAATANASEPPLKKIKVENESPKTKTAKIDSYFTKNNVKEIKKEKKEHNLNSSTSSSKSTESTIDGDDSKDDIVDKKDTERKKNLDKEIKRENKKRKLHSPSSSSKSEDNKSVDETDSKDVQLNTSKKDRERKKDKMKYDVNKSDSNLEDSMSVDDIDSKDDQLNTSKKDRERKKDRKKYDVNKSDSNLEDSMSVDDIDSKDVQLNTSKKDRERKKDKMKYDVNKSDSNFDDSMSVDDIDSKDDQFLPENPLPDVFLDKRLAFYPDFVSIPESERNHFERHWIAYGGIVVKSLKDLDVDYIVHNQDSIEFKQMQRLKRKTNPNVRHVNKNWLMKCIYDVALCDTAKYPVFLKP